MLLHRKFVIILFIYSIISLYQYGLIDIYFIIWVMIQYYLFVLWLKLFQLRPLGALSVGSCVPLTYHIVVVFISLSMSLLSGTTKHFRIIMYVPCPHSRITFSPKSPGSKDNSIRNQDLGVGCSLLLGCHSF